MTLLHSRAPSPFGFCLLDSSDADRVNTLSSAGQHHSNLHPYHGTPSHTALSTKAADYSLQLRCDRRRISSGGSYFLFNRLASTLLCWQAVLIDLSQQAHLADEVTRREGGDRQRGAEQPRSMSHLFTACALPAPCLRCRYRTSFSPVDNSNQAIKDSLPTAVTDFIKVDILLNRSC